MLRALTCLALLLAALAAPRGAAWAAAKDEETLVGIADALGNHLSGKSDDALTALKKLLETCGKDQCEKSTRAQVYLAIGIVYSAGKKDQEAGRLAFENALYEDPTVSPDRQFTNTTVNATFAAAKANFKKSGGQPPPTRPAPSKEQLDAVANAQGQLNGRDWSGCMQTAIGAMVDREFAAGKLILARCEDAGDLILEAQNDAKLALKYAEEERNTDVESQAKALVEKLQADAPSILLVLPRAVTNLEIKFDGSDVSKEDAEKGVPRNPGKVTIEVKGKKGQFPFTFKTTETIDRGEKLTVNVEQEGGKNNAAVQQCLLAATTPDDLKRCIESGGQKRGLTILGGLELSAYNSTDNVNVFSPALYLSAENPTSGWQVGGSVLVDVVSNASPDIVSMASRRFDEQRIAGTLSASYKIGPARVGVNGGFSTESDYVGRAVGVQASADFMEKRVTPSISYNFGLDTLARAGTPWEVFSRELMRHTVDASVSIVMNGSTVMALGGTFEADLGDSSKPYRHVAMFDPAVAPLIPRGATRDLVSQYRLAAAPLEQLPPAGRMRYAIFVRGARRFESSTLRGDERLYIDNWGLKASTTDLRYLLDLNDRLRVGPHLRFHIQSGVDFWQRAYTLQTGTVGPELPKYRTGDRENGPLFAGTLGAMARFGLSEVFFVTLQADAIYTQFLDHLYIFDRLGVYSALTIDMEID